MNAKEKLIKVIESLEFTEDDVQDDWFEGKIVTSAVFIFKAVELSEGTPDSHLIRIEDSRCDFITRRGMLEEALDM